MSSRVKRGIRTWPRCKFLALLGMTIVALASPLHAQAGSAADRELRAQREELDRIRREREALERDAGVLRNTAHDLSEEVANLDRRVEASARIVRSLDRQLELINDQVTTASNSMVKAEVELDE